MKKEWADKWVAALRSKKYHQTKCTLRTSYGFCCLGVLTDLVMQEHPELEFSWEKTKHTPAIRGRYNLIGDTWIHNEGPDVLPDKVQEIVGMRSNDGEYEYQALALAEANDNGASFAELASIIEKNWEKL